MKKKNIFLDFTSLLDVTLIVIFFFVIFSHLDSEENKTTLEEKMGELEASIKVASERESQAQELKEKLVEEIEVVRESDERQAENVEAILEYMKGANAKLILDIEENKWKIRLICNGEVLEEIDNNADIGEKMLQAIKKAGYSKDDTIFFDFVFDGSIPGTSKAYKKVTKGLNDVKEKYKYVYCSETDLSIGE